MFPAPPPPPPPLLQLVEKSRQKGEKDLLQKREKVMLELEKLSQRVDEFNDYSELDMMGQYVQDVRTVQKRIAGASMNRWVYFRGI